MANLKDKLKSGSIIARHEWSHERWWGPVDINECSNSQGLQKTEELLGSIVLNDPETEKHRKVERQMSDHYTRTISSSANASGYLRTSDINYHWTL